MTDTFVHADENEALSSRKDTYTRLSELATRRHTLRKPSWQAHLPRIFRDLQTDSRDFYDRKALAQLFHVGERQAGNILRRVSDCKVDRAFMVSRTHLMESLEALTGPDWKTTETRRVEALNDDILKEIRLGKDKLFAKNYALPAGAKLPEGTAFIHPPEDDKTGIFAMTFNSAEELLGKLAQVADAAANDPMGFQHAVESEGLRPAQEGLEVKP